MVIAALVSFGLLLLAWLFAPDRPRAVEALEMEVPEGQPASA